MQSSSQALNNWLISFTQHLTASISKLRTRSSAHSEQSRLLALCAADGTVEPLLAAAVAVVAVSMIPMKAVVAEAVTAAAAAAARYACARDLLQQQIDCIHD
jgi:hypothetical protein